MFTKILVAEDVGSIGMGVRQMLSSLKIPMIKEVQYCDDAFLQLKKAQVDGQPYELLITDLSFQPDHRATNFASGEELLAAIHTDFTDLKTIVYSIDHRLHKARTLIDQYGINAYVCKGREGLKHLRAAIVAVNDGERYLSPEVSRAIAATHQQEIEDYDIRLLQLLARGYSKIEISDYLASQNITPSSTSSIEKRQGKLLVTFGARNATHLISIVQGIGLI